LGGGEPASEPRGSYMNAMRQIGFRCYDARMMPGVFGLVLTVSFLLVVTLV